MAKNSNRLADFQTENTGGVLSGLLAEEDQFDRRTLWRLGSWGVGAVGAVTIAVLANQSSMRWQRDQVASADLARQAQQIQSVAKESQNETRRLASAIETLNSDRDRLYSRVTVLEQGLDSVTGAIARQSPAAAAPQTVSAPPAMTEPQPAQNPAAAPAPAPVASAVATTAEKKAEKPPADTAVAEQGPATLPSAGPAVPNPPAATPATPLMASKSMMAPPDAAAGKLIEPEKPADAATVAPAPQVVASAPPTETDTSEATPSKVAVQRTEFAVDVGGANSVGGLRALWLGLLKSRSNAALTTLQPIIAIKEGSNGLGMQLRLVAGPLNDAAAAAKICAGLIENKRPCETTVFDGQRLAMKDEPLTAAKPPAAKPSKPVARRRSFQKRVAVEEPPPKPEPSMLSSLFGKR